MLHGGTNLTELHHNADHFWGYNHARHGHRHSHIAYDVDVDYDTNTEGYSKELGRLLRLYNEMVTMINHLADRNVQLETTASILPTKTSDWNEKPDTDCQCLECWIVNLITAFKNDVRISTDTQEYTYNGKKYVLPNYTKVLTKADLKDTKNGVYTPDVSEVLGDAFNLINNINNDIKNIDKMNITADFGTNAIVSGTPSAGNYKVTIKAVKDPTSDNTLNISNKGLYVPPATVLPPAYLDNITALFPWNVANDSTAGVWVNKLLIQGVNVEKRGLRKVTCTIWAETPGEGSKQDMTVDLQINNSGGGVATPKLNIPASWSGILHCDNPRFSN